MFDRHFDWRGPRRWFDEQDEEGERHRERHDWRSERLRERLRERLEKQRQRRLEQFHRRFGGRGGRGPFGRGGRGPFGRGGPFEGDPFGNDFDQGGRRRQRRGDIKYALLELIAEQPRHGYDLIKALEERYGGFYRPS